MPNNENIVDIETRGITDEEKISIIAERFRDIMETLGLDLNDDSLAGTPKRVARMYVQEVFAGLNQNNFPGMTFIEDKYEFNENENVIQLKVDFSSFCEHHFVPFIGEAFVAYIPNKKLVGLSKIPRIVRHFAKRPQVQERLNTQIAESLMEVLETKDVAVLIKAKHFCMTIRGIEDKDSHTTTHVLSGKFKHDPQIRKEFLDRAAQN